MILVLLSPMIAEAVIPGIVIVKSVAFKFPMRFRLIPPLLVPVPTGLLCRCRQSGPVAVVVVVLMLLLSEMLVLVGGVMPKRPRLVAAYLHDHHVDHHFRLGLVKVVDQLLRQRNLIRSSAYDDGVLRLQLLDAADFQQGAHGIHNVLQFGSLR